MPTPRKHEPIAGERIAFFCPSLCAGGAERVTLSLAIGFAERGLPVDLVLASAVGEFMAQVPEGVRVVDLHSVRVLKSLLPLARYMRAERPAAVISAMDHANVVALWARRLAGIRTRLVVTVHDTLSVAVRHAPSFAQRLTPLLIRMFYRWADSVVTVSQGAADDFARCTGLPRERIRVIYNPVVGPEMIEMSKAPLAHPWFAHGAPPVILGAGRLTRQKDFATLIDAFALVRATRDARLLILGEGEERASLEAKVAEKGLRSSVLLPGITTNPYGYMARASLFTLSSLWEGLPTVLIEALALGIPVVSTDCPSGPREVLEGGRWGRLVPPRSPQDLAAAMIEALDSPRLANPSEAVRRFTRAESVRQYLDLVMP